MRFIIVSNDRGMVRHEECMTGHMLGWVLPCKQLPGTTAVFSFAVRGEGFAPKPTFVFVHDLVRQGGRRCRRSEHLPQLEQRASGEACARQNRPAGERNKRVKRENAYCKHWRCEHSRTTAGAVQPVQQYRCRFSVTATGIQDDVQLSVSSVTCTCG